MAVAVQSVSSNSFAPGLSVTINAPSGLAVGDLMVAVISERDSGTTCTPPSGWTTLLETKTPTPSVASYYKVATSGDVSAGNFTFSFSGAGATTTNGCILRITGYNATNPITQYAAAQTSGANPSFANTITPATTGSLLIMGIGTESSTGSSNYAIVTSNPTWTQIVSNSLFAVAYATRTQTTATGNSSITNTDASESACHLIAVRPSFSDTVTESLTVSEVITNITGVTVTESVSVSDTSDTYKSRLWRKTNKPSTTWRKYDK